jgi:hypothetical protein
MSTGLRGFKNAWLLCAVRIAKLKIKTPQQALAKDRRSKLNQPFRRTVYSQPHINQALAEASFFQQTVSFLSQLFQQRVSF